MDGLRNYRSLFVVAALCVVSQGCASGGRAATAEPVPNGWPVPFDVASVSSSFGAPRGNGRHLGLDLSAPKGTPVRATADGVVVFAGRSGDFGRLVIIDHGDGWETRYAHLKAIETREGRRVQRATVIGTVGKSGNASGYHLHYEVLRQGTAIDPGPYL